MTVNVSMFDDVLMRSCFNHLALIFYIQSVVWSQQCWMSFYLCIRLKPVSDSVGDTLLYSYTVFPTPNQIFHSESDYLSFPLPIVLHHCADYLHHRGCRSCGAARLPGCGEWPLERKIQSWLKLPLDTFNITNITIAYCPSQAQELLESVGEGVQTSIEVNYGSNEGFTSIWDSTMEEVLSFSLGVWVFRYTLTHLSPKCLLLPYVRGIDLFPPPHAQGGKLKRCYEANNVLLLWSRFISH